MDTKINGFVVAAPASGSGKTFLTLGLISALRSAGADLASFKVGPDYIDPGFHAAASGRPCLNLDGWAMTRDELRFQFASLSARWRVVEGAMGLFDGPECGAGSTADVAANLDLPVILIVNARSTSQSVAALVAGFASFRSDVTLAGLILNNVNSAKHERMIRGALGANGPPLVGVVPTSAALQLPDRHLGLVQSAEHPDLEGFVNSAGNFVGQHVDLNLLSSVSKIDIPQSVGAPTMLPPLGQRIAVARDIAFQFAYPHVLGHWRSAGAEISFFSPLNDEAPSEECDAVYLPGGYPELHLEILSTATKFKSGLRRAEGAGALIYGECGGYMVLGRHLTDQSGHTAEMAGLLPIATSFATPKRQLGYRKARHDSGLPWPKSIAAHEFHYAVETVRASGIDPLFTCSDACDQPVGQMGATVGRVMGSFVHAISVGESR